MELYGLDEDGASWTRSEGEIKLTPSCLNLSQVAVVVDCVGGAGARWSDGWLGWSAACLEVGGGGGGVSCLKIGWILCCLVVVTGGISSCLSAATSC